MFNARKGPIYLPGYQNRLRQAYGVLERRLDDAAQLVQIDTPVTQSVQISSDRRRDPAMLTLTLFRLLKPALHLHSLFGRG